MFTLVNIWPVSTSSLLTQKLKGLPLQNFRCRSREPRSIIVNSGSYILRYPESPLDRCKVDSFVAGFVQLHLCHAFNHFLSLCLYWSGYCFQLWHFLWCFRIPMNYTSRTFVFISYQDRGKVYKSVMAIYSSTTIIHKCYICGNCSSFLIICFSLYLRNLSFIYCWCHSL